MKACQTEESPMPDQMRYKGRRWKVVFVITLISVLASLLITYVILEMTASEKLPIIVFIAAMAPLIIAPITSWSIVSLMIRIQSLEEAHRQLATYDDLTGLLTRRAFLDQGEALMKLCIRNRQAFALALLDLDNFKAINDRHGHGGGDEVLRAFALIVRMEMGSSVLVGRLGGEEFAIALPGASLSDAQYVLERIRQETEVAEIKYLENAIRLSVSVGISGMQQGSTTSFAILTRQSDDALYQAKARGRNLIVLREIDE